MISIFAKPPYVANLYPKYTEEKSTKRLSSRIRGEELALYGKFKLNPTRGYENDTLVWVKPTGFGHIKDGDWIDVLDGLYKDRHWLLEDRPGINIIAASQNSYDVLRTRLKNKMVLIPHQHLNWKVHAREKTTVDTCGYIGSPSPIAFEIYDRIGKEIEKLGMKWVTCFDFQTRMDAVNFYKSIDILVVGAWELGDKEPHKMPTKIINAASFGIPSVAYPMAGYKEIAGHFIGADNKEQMIRGVKRLRDDDDYYKRLSAKIFKMAKKYHVANVAKMYRRLIK